MIENPGRAHKQTAAILLFFSFIAAMLFFAVVRIFGGLWFKAEFVWHDMPQWLSFLILNFLFIFDITFLLKILTNNSWVKSFIVAFLYNIVINFISSLSIHFITDIVFCLFVPLFFNKNKAKSFGYNLCYFLGIFGYQAIMMYGRGYPMIGSFNAIWQLISTIDYRFFILSIFLLKGVVKNMRTNNSNNDGKKGCFLLWGFMDKLTGNIGRITLMPVTFIIEKINGKK